MGRTRIRFHAACRNTSAFVIPFKCTILGLQKIVTLSRQKKCDLLHRTIDNVRRTFPLAVSETPRNQHLPICDINQPIDHTLWRKESSYRFETKSETAPISQSQSAKWQASEESCQEHAILRHFQSTEHRSAWILTARVRSTVACGAINHTNESQRTSSLSGTDQRRRCCGEEISIQELILGDRIKWYLGDVGSRKRSRCGHPGVRTVCSF